MEASEKAPELKPRRPIYRSYSELIRVLINEALSRVRADKQHPIEPLKITAPMRVLAADILQLRKTLKAKERHLSDVHKAQVMDRCERDSATVPLEYTYSERNRLQEGRPAGYQARLDTIKQLRIRATLDTIDMTPTQAKRYLLDLERRLSKV